MIKARVATEHDKEDIFKLIELHCLALAGQGEITEAKFKYVADFVLKDIDYGFFIMATRDGQPVGMMMFGYQWNIWRRGFFLWM